MALTLKFTAETAYEHQLSSLQAEPQQPLAKQDLVLPLTCNIQDFHQH